MAKKREQQEEGASFEAWVERDLSEAAALGLLSEAFAREEIVDHALDVLRAGRIPVLTGEPGVGKTAIVHELVRRAALDASSPLHGRRVIQVSLARQLATMRRETDFGQALQGFGQELVATEPGIVAFIRDLHVAETANVEPIIAGLAMRVQAPMLAEADAAAFATMTDFAPQLLQWLTPLTVEEPTPQAASIILRRWAEADEQAGGRTYDPHALDLALELAQRFLVRDRLPRKVLELLGQVRATASGSVIEPRDVVERFCRQHRLPESLVDPSQMLDLDGMERDMRERILGQDEACQAIVHVIALVKAGLADLRRPLAAMLFVGPTGVGKTHVAQVLAERLFGRRDRMLRLNLSDFGSPDAAATLFGDPAAHLLPMRRGTLTHRIMGQPFGVLLLDEIEKAHRNVHDRMLQLLDEGCFINGCGETVSCRATIIVATSNAGADLWRSGGLGFRRVDDAAAIIREVDRRLEQEFRFELLNRFDRIVHFEPLSREDIRTIAVREIAGLAARSGLVQRGLHLEADDSILDWLVAHGHDPETGARFLRRTMERHVTAAVADLVVRRSPEAGSTIHLLVRDGKPVATLGAEPARTQAARSTVKGPAARSAPDLLASAQGVLDAAAPRLAELARQRAEHSRLLEALNAPGFWSSQGCRDTLERFRELDVIVQAGSRHAAAVESLREAVSDATEASNAPASPTTPATPATRARRERLATALLAAESALTDWGEQVSGQGASDAWVLIGAAGSSAASSEWIERIARLTCGWCERKGLLAQVAAEQRGADGCVRVVLEVSGPGVVSLLEMERGIHRIVQRPRRDLRLRLDVIPRGAEHADLALVRPARAVTGILGVKHRYAGRVRQEDRGLAFELHGPDRASLAQLLRDLEMSWRPSAEPDIVRIYGDGGDLARDPRTGTTVLRLKQVLEGRLEPFHEAWRQRGRAAPHA